jgi:hypothetical protein
MSEKGWEREFEALFSDTVPNPTRARVRDRGRPCCVTPPSWSAYLPR